MSDTPQVPKSTPVTVQEIPAPVLVDFHRLPTKYYFATIMQNGGNMSNLVIQGSIVRAIVDFRQRNIPVVFTNITEISADEYNQLIAISGVQDEPK